MVHIYYSDRDVGSNQNMDEQTVNINSVTDNYVNFYILGPPKTGWTNTHPDHPAHPAPTSLHYMLLFPITLSHIRSQRKSAPYSYVLSNEICG